MTSEQLPSHVIVLTPSKGRGGGIEAYAEDLIDAIQELQVTVREIPLVLPGASLGLALKARYLARVLRVGLRLRGRKEKVEVLCLHPGLLPVALLARLVLGRSRPVTSFTYGDDIWGADAVTRRLRHLRAVRPVAISSFSAGAMSDGGPVLLLPPTVQAQRFERLLTIPRPTKSSAEVVALSVFRLEDYPRKGGPELVAAVARLREQGCPVSLTIAGFDGQSDQLEADLHRYGEWMRVMRSPDADQLVNLYAEADVFVLASRCPPAGEGFGIVLVEAALARLPVVAPANDGSADAFISGVTGLRPRDQSVDALIDILRWLAEHPTEMRTMGRNGRVWAERALDPVGYRSRVSSVLWGYGSYQGWLGVELVSP